MPDGPRDRCTRSSIACQHGRDERTRGSTVGLSGAPVDGASATPRGQVAAPAGARPTRVRLHAHSRHLSRSHQRRAGPQYSRHRASNESGSARAARHRPGDPAGDRAIRPGITGRAHSQRQGVAQAGRRSRGRRRRTDAGSPQRHRATPTQTAALPRWQPVDRRHLSVRFFREIASQTQVALLGVVVIIRDGSEERSGARFRRSGVAGLWRGEGRTSEKFRSL